MKQIGAHVSIAGGVETAPQRAHKIAARAFAMFVKNQRRWFAKPLTEDSISRFTENCSACGFSKELILPHAGYLINLGTTHPDNASKSLEALKDELNRCRLLGLRQLNVHPGAHLGNLSEDQCLKLIASNINRALEATKNVRLLIENTAGDGTHLGYRFEHLARIIEFVEDKSRIGVCIDTCHLFASGYDIRNRENYEKTWREFEKTVGIKWLKGMHLNDSRFEVGSRVDRHASIGEGKIGLEAFKMIARDKRFENIPLILETPKPGIWHKEIALLYKFADEND